MPNTNCPYICGKTLANMLNRIRVGVLSIDDLKILQKRVILPNEDSYPVALHVFSFEQTIGRAHSKTLLSLEEPINHSR